MVGVTGVTKWTTFTPQEVSTEQLGLFCSFTFFHRCIAEDNSESDEKMLNTCNTSSTKNPRLSAVSWVYNKGNK